MHRHGLPQLVVAEELQTEAETVNRKNANACAVCVTIAPLLVIAAVVMGKAGWL